MIKMATRDPVHRRKVRAMEAKRDKLTADSQRIKQTLAEVRAGLKLMRRQK